MTLQWSTLKFLDFSIILHYVITSIILQYYIEFRERWEYNNEKE